MKLNIIHRADAGAKAREALSFQVHAAMERNLRFTILLSYNGLQDPETVDLVRQWARTTPEVEVGLHFHELKSDRFQEEYGSSCPAMYLMHSEERYRFLDDFFNQFRTNFDTPLRSVGGYVIDAPTLRFIHKIAPDISAAITTCFEEGVKMYHGNNHSWTLFNDGGPWGPYYPSRENILVPAGSKADAIGILGLPHLNRDMLLSITHRDDLFASHPINLMRARVAGGESSPYMKRFVREWIRQDELNRDGYYSFFVSSPWVSPGHPFITSLPEARSLYLHSLDDLAELRDTGEVQDMQMAEFAEWHRDQVGFGKSSACLWRDVIAGSERQMFWHLDAKSRVTVDLNAGGTIVDLRPLAGRINRDLGPDGSALWNGTYPFIVSSELRGGHSKSIFGGRLGIGDQEIALHERRAEAIATRQDDDTVVLEFGNVTYGLAGWSVTLATRMSFVPNDSITIQRRVVAIAPDDANGVQFDGELTITEELIGTWGTTEYQEPMDGIVLTSGDLVLPWDYRGTRATSESATASVQIPQGAVQLSMGTRDGLPAKVSLETGHLFSPNFKVSIARGVSVGEESSIWIKLEPM